MTTWSGTENKRFERTSRWLRLEDGGLGMPLPAVYIPAAHLPEQWPLLGRFAPCEFGTEGTELPMVERVGADIQDPASMTLYEVEIDPGARRGGAVVNASTVEIAKGHFTEPSTRAWRDRAYRGRLIIVAFGAVTLEGSYTIGQLVLSPTTRFGVVPLLAPEDARR